MEYAQPSRSIIQIGVAVGHLESGLVLESACFNIHVDEILSDFIKTLTGIQQEDVDTGISLQSAYSEIQMMHAEYQCFRNALTWGGGDSDDLRQALGLDVEKYVFGRRWIDAKTVFVSRCFARNEKHQAGLAKAMQRVGLEFKGRKHNAKDDAVNTFLIYHKLLQELRGG